MTPDANSRSVDVHLRVVLARQRRPGADELSVTDLRLSPLSSTTNVAAVPSVTTGAPVMLTFGSPSLSSIVPVAVSLPVANAALPGALSVTVNVSPS